jgi:hypothetical protein
MKTFVFTFLVMACCFNSFAQSNSPFSIGINAGTLIYNGDLSPSRLGSWKTPGIVVGLSGHKNLSHVLATRLEISIGAMRGDDAAYSSPEWRKHRALAFASRVTEAAIAAEWSPLGRERKIYPYALAGVGFSSMRIVPDYTRFDAAYFAGEPEVAANIVKSFSKIPQGVAIFPVGFGAGYHLSPKFSLHAEAVHRFTRNDYIDGFSHSEAVKLKDGYTKYSIGLRYNWGYRDRNGCPTNVY